MNASIQILAFGKLTDVLGKEPLEIEVVNDTSVLREYLAEHYPGMKEAVYRFAVNAELINGMKALKPGDTIALLPPFSGG